MEFVDLGKIVNTHGVHGEVKVLPFASDLERFRTLKKVYIRDADNKLHSASADNASEYEVRGCKVLKTTVALRFLGVTSADDAEKLRNRIISIDKNDVPKLPEDVYYLFDLIGCKVYDGDTLIGKINDVIQTGANDVYSLVDNDGDTILIPAVRDVIRTVDIDSKRIEVSLPAGLLDVYKTNDINDDL